MSSHREADRRGFPAAEGARDAGTHDVKKLRIGMYQRYGGGNIDEGWTRWLIEDFKFPSVPCSIRRSRRAN